MPDPPEGSGDGGRRDVREVSKPSRRIPSASAARHDAAAEPARDPAPLLTVPIAPVEIA